MPDPREAYFIFADIADDVSRKNSCRKGRVINLLLSDLWNEKFDSQKLRWNEYKVSLVLWPGEPHFLTRLPPLYSAEKGADDRTIRLEPDESIATLYELEIESLVRRANAISGGEQFTDRSNRSALIRFLLDRGRNEQAPAARIKSAPVKPAGPLEAPGVVENMTEAEVSKLFEATTEGGFVKEHSPCPDYPEETTLDELFGHLSTVGEPLVSNAFDEAGRPNFRRLAQIELHQYSDSGKVVVKNVAIPGDEASCFCRWYDFEVPKRYGRALTPETQPQNLPQSEAGLASNTLHTQSQSETAKLRKRLTKWIEEFAATDEAKGLVKAEFFQRARGEVDLRIPYWMFREAWSAAEIPAAFKKAGPRLKRTSE